MLLGLHQGLAQSTVLYFAALGVWGIVMALRRAPFDSGYRGALIIGVGLGVVQALVGLVVLLVGGRGPRDDLHYLYGLSIIVALPLVHQLISGRKFPPVLAYALASLFVMGLALRAMTTGL